VGAAGIIVTVLCAEDALVVVFPDVQVGERLVPEVQAIRAGRVQRARHVILL
jgi:preprotein translocase subunit SecD